ncbi:MAG: putative porin [Bacteroidales bacterium]|nr:putative porin [Bacteroidales bacterium]
MRLLIVILAVLTSVMTTVAQQQRANTGGKAKGQSNDKKTEKVFIRPNVRAWRMIDNYTLADTIAVDTLTNGHQINNKIWKENVMNVTLGNLGSPYLSMLYLTKRRTEGNILYNTLQAYLEQPEDLVFFNTKTPYTNLTYNMGFPKRRSEEYVHVFFTQNVNKRLNVGAKYQLSTSIGRYEQSRADHTTVRFFSSYDGDYYKYNMSLSYTRNEIQENSGIVNDDYVLYPDSGDYQYDKPDDIPVKMTDQKNRLSTYQALYAHQMDLAHIERFNPADSSVSEIPVATAFHQIHLMKNHREFKIDKLQPYLQKNKDFFPAILNDSTHTVDSTRYFSMTNLFQLKLNEEFNSKMKFGLRAFIGNDFRRYYYPNQTVRKPDVKNPDKMVVHYSLHDTIQVCTFFGGQIFKNMGEHFKWNAGAKLYIQGYRRGDFTINGQIAGMFPIGKKEATIWAKATINQRSPEIYENMYMSNHFKWDKQLESEHTLDIRGGVKIEDMNLDLTVFAATEDNKVYFDKYGHPAQKTEKGDAVKVFGAYLYKHFSIIGFNCIARLTYQHTSDMSAEPLPEFALYTSNFYENLFFNVLTLQIGFDWRYNTKYYAPQYIPAIMQFCDQDNTRKVGNYHYLDPFVNLQLKRARIYVKYEHINSMWSKNHDYFHTIGYPANPGFFKFGVSWNFYD